jgi:hypothetical protein
MGDGKTIELNNIPTVWLFRGRPPFQKPHNTNRDMTDLQYSPHHIGQYSSVKLLHARPLVLLLPQRKQWSKIARHTVFRFQQNPNLCESYTELYNKRRHTSETISTTCKAIHRERGIDREWTEQRKMSAQKTASKQSTTCSRPGSTPTKRVLVDASPRTKTS